MKQVKLRHRAGEYSIKIENGLLSRCGEEIRAMKPSATRVLAVSDTNVFPLYGDRVLASLAAAGLEVSSHVFEAGEENKRLSTVEGIYNALHAAKITRSDVVAALGGGVVGDIAGFAAATWLRGVDFVQCPTTLLAMVDSSIGGKTGVDLAAGKNLVGAFRQPLGILSDPTALDTLTPRIFADGMAEIIKHACICDAELFASLADADAIDREWLVHRNAAIKAGYVERDEFERGERMQLNFGHTVGHAIEKAHGFTGITHGEAVGIGMLYSARIGEEMGITAPGTRDAIETQLVKYGLPTSTELCAQVLAEAMGADKKRAGDSISFVFAEEIGRAKVVKLALSDIAKML